MVQQEMSRAATARLFAFWAQLKVAGDRGKSFQLLDAPGVGVSKNFHVLLPSGKRP